MACELALLFSTKQKGCHECPEEKCQRFQSAKDLVVQQLLDSSTHSVQLEQNCTLLNAVYVFGFVGKISRTLTPGGL